MIGAMLAAPIAGSFMGVLIRRLPAGRPVALARSCCESCGTALRAADLVPLVSFLVQRGRCRHCGARVSLFHPGIELAALAVPVSAVSCGLAPDIWWWCVLGWGLLTLAWIDAECLLLPDVLTLPLIVLGLLQGTLASCPEPLDRSLGALAGWGVFVAVSAVYRHVRRREGLGGGDAKLLAVSGSWLGLSCLPFVIVTASVSAAVWILARSIVSSRGLQEPVAFGPFLAAATWLAVLTGAPAC